jgi:hypothetical protein
MAFPQGKMHLAALLIILLSIPCSVAFRFAGKLSTSTKVLQNQRQLKLSMDLSNLDQLMTSLPNQLEHFKDLPSLLLSEEAASIYTRVDKTGFIGFIATYIEVCIDLFRGVFKAAGIQNAYGPAIILFTIIGKIH